MGNNIFDDNSSLSSITINKSCSDIKNIVESSTSNNKFYPWLSRNIPYTASGVTIYGAILKYVIVIKKLLVLQEVFL